MERLNKEVGDKLMDVSLEPSHDQDHDGEHDVDELEFGIICPAEQGDRRDEVLPTNLRMVVPVMREERMASVSVCDEFNCQDNTTTSNESQFLEDPAFRSAATADVRSGPAENEGVQNSVALSDSAISRPQDDSGDEGHFSPSTAIKISAAGNDNLAQKVAEPVPASMPSTAALSSSQLRMMAYSLAAVNSQYSDTATTNTLVTNVEISDHLQSAVQRFFPSQPSTETRRSHETGRIHSNTSECASSLSSTGLSAETSQGIPKYPQFAKMGSRIITFHRWPKDYSVKPTHLASAGFYYLGTIDECRCFFCGGTLRQWQSTDDPFVEHARWYPRCSYIRQLVGEEFVEVVQELNNDGSEVTLSQVAERMALRGLFTINLDNSVPEVDDEHIVFLNTEQQSRRDDSRTSLSELHTEGAESAAVGYEQFGYRGEPDGQDHNLQGEALALRCRICQTCRVRIVLLPCHHLVSCMQCYKRLSECPECHQTIEDWRMASLRRRDEYLGSAGFDCN